MAHTPGPWEIQTPFAPDCYSIVQEGLQTHEWQFIAQVPVGIPAEAQFPRQEAKANARLIAAAPDLLAALEKTLSAANAYFSGVNTAWRDEAEAAIAKAKGLR